MERGEKMKEESDYDCKLCTHLCLTGHLGSAPEERSTHTHTHTHTRARQLLNYLQCD